MRVQCDVCEERSATVICCADEAALCAKCDTEVHAANKLASKHQRLQLQSLPNKLPTCDICQDKSAFIFCVEDRALFCQDCNESIHSVNALVSNHQRYLATGVHVALGSLSSCRNESEKISKEPCNQNAQQIPLKQTVQQHPHNFSTPVSWAVDDLLEFPKFDSSEKKVQLEVGGGFDWWSTVNLFEEQICHEAMAAAEVPQLPVSPSQPNDNNTNIQCNYRPTKTSGSIPYKRARVEVSPKQDDNDEYSIVPDLG